MKKIVCMVFAVMIAACSLVIPSFAAEGEAVIPWNETNSFVDGYYYGTDVEWHDDGVYTGTMYYGMTTENQLAPGRYMVEGVNPKGEFGVEAMRVFLILTSDGGMTSESYALGQVFEVPEGMAGTVLAQAQYGYPILYSVSGSSAPSVSGDGLFWDAYGLFHGHIFGGAELTSYQDFMCTALATISVLVVSLLPFVLVFMIVRFGIGRW